MAGKYLGAVLVERGIMQAEQVEAVLARQRQTGQPFGQTAVTLFNIRMTDVWRALAVQSEDDLQHVDLDAMPSPTREALDTIPGRLAWAGKVLPLRVDGDRLTCATTRRSLTDAVAMLHERLDRPIEFVLADELQLKQHIMQNYPL